MVRLRRILLTITTVLCVCGLGFSGPGVAGQSDDGARAEAFITVLSTKALALVADKSLDREVRRQRFANLLEQGFDMPWIGQFVLGRNWNLANPEQRADYLKLFKAIIVFTYSRRFDDYSGQQVAVTGHKFAKRKYVFVTSKIFDPQRAGSTINVTWRLLPDKESFKIVDVVIEGVSMGVTQRNEYASVIQRNGGKIASLIEAMRENLAKLQRND